MSSGWNLWVWLVSGVVRRYKYYRYPHNNYYFSPTPLVFALFLAVSSLFLCSFLNVFLYFYISTCIFYLARAFSVSMYQGRRWAVKFGGARI